MKMNVYYNKDYTASPEAFETTRKSSLIAEKIERTLGDTVDVVDPRNEIHQSEVDELITQTHSDRYVRALKTGSPLHLAMSSGFEWGSTTYDFALAHSHGIVAGIRSLIDPQSSNVQTRTGSLSSGLHHASPTEGRGFCTVNGLAVGARYAVQNGRKVMILDFDAHCGGGTMSHIRRLEEYGLIENGDIIQIDVSVSPFDVYEANSPHFMNIHKGRSECSDDDYIDAIAFGLSCAESRYEDGTIIIYNAGIDPINTVDFSNPMETIERREELVSSWIGDKPACFTLAGGYKWGGFSAEDIADAHILNISSWARHATKVGI